MRKRRSRVTWFPVLGTDYGLETSGPSTVFQGFTQFGAGSPEGTITEAYPVPILDDNDTTETETASLRDRVEGKDYLAKRVVGKIWAATEQQTIGPGDTGVMHHVFCAAIAVLAVTPAGEPDSDPAEWNPLFSANSAKPWMWRRTWVLYNNLAVASPSGAIFTGPTNILNQGGGQMDAGHIDVRVSRRVRKEERLFLITTAMILTNSDSEGGNTSLLQNIEWGFDVRVLGGMRRSANRSALT